MDHHQQTRRAFLVDGAGLLAAGALGSRVTGGYRSARRTAGLTEPRETERDALRALGRTLMRRPDSLPHPHLAEGTDTIPEIEHVVVLMLENHSYDNFLGMLGRGPGRVPRGDGFTLGRDGYPTATNPYANGSLQRAFRMPTTCQLSSQPSQEWQDCHVQYDNGTNEGFVVSRSGAAAMGYWTEQDLPFMYGLARHFPIADRWFCSVLGQTDPNRRYLIAATSSGMTDDIGASAQNLIPDVALVLPSNGTIFERLDAAGLSWIDYYTSFPTGTTAELYPVLDTVSSLVHAKHFDEFFTDAQAGTLPSFSLLDPNYTTQSQENPQNIVLGEAVLEQVVTALSESPAWEKTLLIYLYDEHGGYYDHVPPPPALKPDAIPPFVQPGEKPYDGFARYGFRVPAMVIGPYAKHNHVSHVLYDHTSILAFLEHKWNLRAMTYRDANANNLTDFLDLNAMASRNPTFPELPSLPAPAESGATLECDTTGPGVIPPPSPPPIRFGVDLRNLGIHRRRHALELELWTTRSTLTDVTVELHHRGDRVAKTRVATLSEPPSTALLRIRGRAPARGHYTVLVRHRRKVLLRRGIRVP